MIGWNMRLTCLSIVAAVFGGPQAVAVTGDDEDVSKEIEEIIVTGIKLSNKRIIEAKRYSVQISDSIASDDIASLPDFNLAESLQRVPGVSTDLDNGEDRFVIVRGMNSEYNFTTMDGLTLPSSDSLTRAVLFDVVPSSVVKRVDILKSFSADLDGESIGGRINLVSRSAFDREGMRFAINSRLGRYEEGTLGFEEVDPSYRVNGAFTNTFGANNAFGVVIAANYELSDKYTVAPTHSGAVGFLDVGDSLVPDIFNSYLYFNSRKRTGFLGRLEYQSDNDDFYAYVSAYGFAREDVERLDEHRIRTRATASTTSDVTATSGSVDSNIEPAVAVRDSIFDDMSSGIQIGFESQLADNQKIEAKWGYSTAELDQEVYRTLFFGSRTADLSFDYSLNSDNIFVANYDDPTAFTNASLVNQHFETQFDDVRNEEVVMEAKMDYSFNLEEGVTGLGFKAGLKFRQKERNRDVNVLEYRPSSANRRLYPLSLVLDERSRTFNSLIHGEQPVFFIDLQASRDFLVNNPGIVAFRNAQSNEQSAQGDYDIQEDVYAAYLMGVWSNENLRISAGLRYETTHTDADGALRNSISGEDSFTAVNVKNDYNHLLPRADITYDITENWRIRAAYSKSVSRPDYHDLRPNVTVGERELGFVTISGGNPRLEPRVSDNFDISLEYYFDSVDGLFSIGLFRKDIEDEIFVRSNVEQDVPFNGRVVQLTTRTVENAENAELAGIEVGLIISSFDFLPQPFSNFGVAANYAYIDSEASFGFFEEGATEPEGAECIAADGGGFNCIRTLPGLFQQPKESANFSINYAQGPFEAKVAYNYRGKRLRNIQVDGDARFDRYFLPQERVDAQLRYWMTDNFRVSFDAKNLTGSFAHQVVGNDLELHHTYRDVGTSYWLGISYKY